MQELDDIALLREYVEHGSEEAFAMLVARHVNKIYSVALRQTRNPHSAEEITQAVFVILAKRSRDLPKAVILSGWLCRTAQLTAVTFIRGEIRRARREQEAHMQTSLNEIESDVWPQIAPLLGAAMAGLNETDHHAVVLRFFDGKSMKEIGAALGASEEAAQKRVSRAVEKLRLFFTKRGVILPAAVLTAAISANSVQAAPAVLAKTTIAVALGRGATASTSTLVQGALKVMAWTNAKTAVALGAAAILAVGTSAFVAQSQFKAGANFPASTWVYAGYNDPASTVKTLMWAIGRNDAKTIFASVSPACQAEFLELAAESKPPISVERLLLQNWADKVRHVSEFRILKSDILSDDQVLLNLSFKMEGRSGTGNVWIGLKKIEGQWKLDDCDPKSNVNGRTGRPPLSRTYGGIGVKLRVDEKTHDVLIKEVIPDSPASRAGLSAGLVVKTINGVPTTKKTAPECVFLTRGLVDRSVWLELVNPERNETNTVELERKARVP